MNLSPFGTAPLPVPAPVPIPVAVPQPAAVAVAPPVPVPITVPLPVPVSAAPRPVPLTLSAPTVSTTAFAPSNALALRPVGEGGAGAGTVPPLSPGVPIVPTVSRTSTQLFSVNAGASRSGAPLPAATVQAPSQSARTFASPSYTSLQPSEAHTRPNAPPQPAPLPVPVPLPMSVSTPQPAPAIQVAAAPVATAPPVPLPLPLGGSAAGLSSSFLIASAPKPTLPVAPPIDAPRVHRQEAEPQHAEAVPAPPPPLQPLAIPVLGSPAPAPAAAASSQAMEAQAAEPPEQKEPVALKPSVDYSAYVYPKYPFASSSGEVSAAGPLAPAGPPPGILAFKQDLPVDAAAAAAVPEPLPPSAVVFGGAKYGNGAFVKCPRPVAANASPARHQDPSEEWRRLQFMINQLTLAKNYLQLETGRTANAVAVAMSNAARHAQRRATDRGGSDRTGTRDQEEEEEIDYSKTNIWTVAYGGSSRQLQTYIDKVRKTELLHGVGYVVLHHRQWGIKKSGEDYQIGLGMKATPLQFAAVAQRLDNVIVLLSNGARDASEPKLKALLSPETYSLIVNAIAPAKKTFSKPAPPPAAAVPAAPNAEAGSAPTEPQATAPLSPGDAAPATPVPLQPSTTLATPQFTSVSIQPVTLFS